jgi:hypothetical protein
VSGRGVGGHKSDDNDESDFIKAMKLLTSSVCTNSVSNLRLAMLSYTYVIHKSLCPFLTDHITQLFSTPLSGEASSRVDDERA